MSAKQRRAVSDRVAQIPDGKERLLLATGRYIGEGFDDARLDTLFLCAAYRAIGYARSEGAIGFAKPADEPVVEYDEELLRNLDDRDDFV
jgi:hypothetical protein